MELIVSKITLNPLEKSIDSETKTGENIFFQPI
jgi:hypothetical protein